MNLALQRIAGVLGVPGDWPAVSATGWSVDTRTQQPGDLYFALRGPNHDGHSYVNAALRQGAAGAVVEKLPETSGGNVLLVPDSLHALQNLAAWARQNWGGTVVGVTGSAGKTTAKDAIAHLLSVAFPIGKTNGNLNNHIGVPLSILRLPADARAAVLEMGMNHAGELRALGAIARPDIAVVTNVGYAHVEFFDSIDGVAAAKRELVESLPRAGVAVLNADDARVAAFQRNHPGRSVTFGFSEQAEVRAENVDLLPAGSRFRALGVEFESSVPGRHGVMNLLAALAVARVFEVAPEGLREAVRSFAPGKMRGQRLEHNGIVVWDDCYNSNPEAAESMLDVLRETRAAHRIAVLGEMLELGEASGDLHRRVGRHAARGGVDLLIGVRGAARAMVEAAAAEGLPAEFVEDPKLAGERARNMARAGDAILFKGSRGVRMELALERFLAER
ncbi:MAG TPA: UDP-N-acetylmuramoyl-tripeptide--D-alanyl-D-alanine ligase [Bryobacteraceae bacterium]|nr:UDP-N-acetylmuramoyl-tripeptide--D-alanyl-D-alanine ligase [Bryobacteraceae bacterium]